jgi:hypothetical protein
MRHQGRTTRKVIVLVAATVALAVPAVVQLDSEKVAFRLRAETEG